jgi:hypothetical protein
MSLSKTYRASRRNNIHRAGIAAPRSAVVVRRTFGERSAAHAIFVLG